MVEKLLKKKTKYYPLLSKSKKGHKILTILKIHPTGELTASLIIVLRPRAPVSFV